MDISQNPPKYILNQKDISFIDLYPIVFSRMSYYLKALSLIIIIYNLGDLVFNNVALDREFLLRVIGGLFGSALFIVVLTFINYLYIRYQDIKISIFEEGLDVKSKWSDFKINYKNYPNHKLEITDNYIAFISTLPEMFLNPIPKNRLLSRSVFIYAPKSSQIRETLLSYLHKENKSVPPM